MLVEDDNNLREIYEARLAAEGYTIVSAQDGEAALALAAKEHPDLVITDVMMPKISGFEMLDILRNTEALRDVKVIMLTALGQAEDNARANSLGADRYLVKSQVTLEDIVKATHEVLEPAPVALAAAEPGSWQAGVSEDTAAPDAAPVDTATPRSTAVPIATVDTTTSATDVPLTDAVSAPAPVVASTTDITAVEPETATTPAVAEPAATSPSPVPQPEFAQPVVPAIETEQPAQVQPIDPEIDSTFVAPIQLPDELLDETPAEVPDANVAALPADEPVSTESPAYIETAVAPINIAGLSDDTPTTTSQDSDTTAPTGSVSQNATDQPISAADAPASDEPATDTVLPEPVADTDLPAAVDTTVVTEPEVITSEAFTADAVLPAFDESTPNNTGSPTPEVLAAQAEIDAAAPSSQEESVIHDQINEFLGNLPANPEATAPVAEPAGDPTVAAAVATEPDYSEVHQPPADEPVSEYEKDASTPDMGELDVHTDESTAQASAGTETATGTTDSDTNVSSEANYPSQAYELPSLPGAAIGDTTAVQSSGDKLVSDAFNEDVSTPQPVAAPSTAEQQSAPLEQPSGSAAGVSQPPSPVGPAPAAAGTTPGATPNAPLNPVTRKRVIAPLNTTPGPDINQLLALEEAKAAATQAGNVLAPTNNQPPDPANLADWQPLPVSEQPRQDKYNSGVDPNSISL
jgi:CheY-like chemotaxis protein